MRISDVQFAGADKGASLQLAGVVLLEEWTQLVQLVQAKFRSRHQIFGDEIGILLRCVLLRQRRQESTKEVRCELIERAHKRLRSATLGRKLRLEDSRFDFGDLVPRLKKRKDVLDITGLDSAEKRGVCCV